MFGHALHTFQDSWSHQDAVDAHVDETWDYTWIDNRWNGRDLTMAQETYDALVQYLEAHPNVRARPAPSPPFPEEFVTEYLRQDVLHGKELLLNVQGHLRDYARLNVQRSGGRSRGTRVNYSKLSYTWRFEQFELGFSDLIRKLIDKCLENPRENRFHLLRFLDLLERVRKGREE